MTLDYDINDTVFPNRIISTKTKLPHLIRTRDTINQMIEFIEKNSPIYPDLCFSTTLGIFMSKSLQDCQSIQIIVNEPDKLVFITYAMLDGMMVANQLYSNCFYEDGWIDNLPLSDANKTYLKQERKDGRQ